MCEEGGASGNCLCSVKHANCKCVPQLTSKYDWYVPEEQEIILTIDRNKMYNSSVTIVNNKHDVISAHRFEIVQDIRNDINELRVYVVSGYDGNRVPLYSSSDVVYTFPLKRVKIVVKE